MQGNFVNSGTGKIAGQIQLTGSNFAGNVSNTGTISSGRWGISVGLTTLTGGITNTGTITATDFGITAGISTWSGVISNSGMITANTTGILLPTTNTYAAATIVNTGTISGSTAAIDVSGYVNRALIDQAGGLLSGAIKLSTSTADVLNVTGGVINGNITGGAVDTVNFALGVSNTLAYSHRLAVEWP